MLKLVAHKAIARLWRIND